MGRVLGSCILVVPFVVFYLLMVAGCGDTKYTVGRELTEDNIKEVVPETEDSINDMKKTDVQNSIEDIEEKLPLGEKTILESRDDEDDLENVSKLKQTDASTTNRLNLPGVRGESNGYKSNDCDFIEDDMSEFRDYTDTRKPHEKRQHNNARLRHNNARLRRLRRNVKRKTRPGYPVRHQANSKRQKRSEDDDDEEEEEEEEDLIDDYGRLIDHLQSLSAIKYQLSPFDINKSQKKNVIEVTFSPFKILSVDEREQSVTISSYIIVKWRDDALKWMPKKYGNIRTVSLRTSKIWTPDILIPKANGDGFRLIKPEYTLIVPGRQANVRMATLFKFTISCDFDMSLYPFDTQNCPILFVDEGDRPLQALQSDEEFEEGMKDFFSTSGEWEIIEKTQENLHDDSLNFFFKSALQFSITMKRRSAFYIANLLVPVYITSFIALFVFWIPPETGEKISFMVSIYVSTAMYISIINDVLPRSLSSLPSFNIVIVLVNVEIGLTFIATLIVLRLYRRHIEREKKNAESGDVTISKRGENGSRYQTSPYIFDAKRRAGRNREFRDNTVSPVAYLDDPLPAAHDETSTFSSSRTNPLKRFITWLDYRKLDKIFFCLFSLSYFLALCIPWFVNL